MEPETLNTNGYKIKTDIFEGPFHLLLGLIEGRKLFINDISLASVAEDYLKYLDTFGKENNLEKNKYTDEIASFIVVAATLILIKSKSLLPNLVLTEEEKVDIHSLEDRLKQYEFYSNLSLNVKSLFGTRIIFPLAERKNYASVFLPDNRITKENIFEYAREVLGRVPKKEILQKVEVKKVISIEEMIEKLSDRIEEAFRMNFKDFSGSQGQPKTREEKVVMIVSFLAMLELVRQGILNVVQENNFEDIIIEKQTMATEAA